jgi:hypothetical protein
MDYRARSNLVIAARPGAAMTAAGGRFGIILPPLRASRPRMDADFVVMGAALEAISSFWPELSTRTL